MKKPVLLAAVLAVLFACLQASSAGQTCLTRPQPPAGASPRPTVLDAGFGKMPLQFVPNEGQVDGPAAFYLQGRDKTIYFAANGLTFVLNEGNAAERWVVKLDFLGADPRAVPVSLERSGAVFSYFNGRAEDWHPGLQASSRIIYRDLWPSIDLVCEGTMDRLKSSFVVRPGADPATIRFAYRGAESVTLTPRGRLAVATPAGGFEDEAPQAWQESAGGRTGVAAAYRLGAEVGFEVGAYDPRLPLVIDPTILVYCGFIGGATWDEGNGVAVDGLGYAYVTGNAQSQENTFPVKVGPDLTFNGWPQDIFVAKVSADGSELVYCGFIGGLGLDNSSGIAVDGAGCAYIAGRTLSANFPYTPGSVLVPTGTEDAVVAKVNASGTALEYVGCIGGASEDKAVAIAVDGAGCAYVVGWTYGLMPSKVGPDLTANGSEDAFIAKVNAVGTDLVYCGYIGGYNNEEAYAVAVDAAGNAYVAGRGASPDFPFKGGPGLTTYGWLDAFVAKVKADGTGLDYAGYIGGRWDDVCRGIALDAAGNAYVAGITGSDETTFMLKAGPDLSWNGGSSDAFVAKVNPDGSLAYSGYIGGEDNDGGLGIALDAAGNAYVTGGTGSPESTFPVREGSDMTYNGSGDAFIAKVNPAGTGLVYCGYLGGDRDEAGWGIAIDGATNAYIVGTTFSRDPSFPVLVGPDLTANGAYPNDEEAFVAKLSAFGIPAPSLSSISPAGATAGDPALAVSIGGTGFESGAVVMWDGLDLATTFLSDHELSAEVGADLLLTDGIVSVAVRNPNGGVSNTVVFTVNNPAPALTSLSPVQAKVGGPRFVLTLTGTRFAPGCWVRWDGQDRVTTYVSPAELQITVEAADIDAAGRYPVTVVNPGPGGGSTAPLEFAVVTFSLDATPASVTVTAGESATYTIRVTPQFGPFDSAVTLYCSSLPRACSYTLSPMSVTPGGSQTSSTLTMKTTASNSVAGGASMAASAQVPPAVGLFILALGAIWPWLFRAPALHKSGRRWAVAMVMIGLAVLIAGCSAGDLPRVGTPAGTYQVTLTGASGDIIMTAPIILVVR